MSTLPSMDDPMIEAVGLSKFYGDFAAVREVSFSIRRGEVVAFLGPNGAGKSTTMKLLTGYLSPSEGRAQIAGHDMGPDRIAGSACSEPTWIGLQFLLSVRQKSNPGYPPCYASPQANRQKQCNLDG